MSTMSRTSKSIRNLQIKFPCLYAMERRSFLLCKECKSAGNESFGYICTYCIDITFCTSVPSNICTSFLHIPWHTWCTSGRGEGGRMLKKRPHRPNERHRRPLVLCSFLANDHFCQMIMVLIQGQISK